MGVLFDYFRASDGQVALQLLDEGDGIPHGPTTVDTDIDALDAKGIDSTVILGKLLALILNVPWSVDLVATVMVWPPEETKPASVEEADRLPEDSPWTTGPWLEELNDRVRDAFANVDDYALPSIADQWARIEEFDGHMDATLALDIVEAFVALARRAQQANERLYCWCCL
ncbi:hypothetical protein [Actinomadura alba]|uniref:DUF4253 domain-containing protein n=1 Tax=Actinomadura alba TaxID=406431 RepID=A0ABR7LXL3_9ACTN|nr:hypothetical protein [Actinomadura alba]MBC6469289.1 hypothetical protein [Actinomadura alba]